MSTIWTSSSNPQRNMDQALDTTSYTEPEVGVLCHPSGQTGSSVRETGETKSGPIYFPSGCRPSLKTPILFLFLFFED